MSLLSCRWEIVEVEMSGRRRMLGVRASDERKGRSCGNSWATKSARGKILWAM